MTGLRLRDGDRWRTVRPVDFVVSVFWSKPFTGSERGCLPRGTDVIILGDYLEDDVGGVQCRLPDGSDLTSIIPRETLEDELFNGYVIWIDRSEFRMGLQKRH